MTPVPSVEERQGREISHYRSVAAQDPEVILGWQSAARRVGAIASSIPIRAER